MRRAALALGALVVSLAGAELLLELRPPQLSNEHVLRAGYTLDDAVIYAKPRYLDPAYYVRNSDRPTLVALGDSFTSSVRVSERRTYPSRLQRILSRRGTAMNVINLGTGDTGPDQQLRLFERYALPNVRPEAVVWQFYANDLWDNASKAVFEIEAARLRPISAASNWLYRRQRIFDLTPLPATLKLQSSLYLYVLKATERWATSQVPARYARDPDQWALEKIRLEIGEMERLGAQHDFATYFVVVPPQATYLANPQPQSCADLSQIRRRDAQLREALRSHPGFIDFEPGARGDPSVNERYFARPDRDGNCLGDRHLNVRGYRVMARRIATRVLAETPRRSVSR
jgi:lysophospholipase L1-like esterase